MSKRSIDAVVLPIRLADGFSGGPMFSTHVDELDSGATSGNQNWSNGKMRYDLKDAIRGISDVPAMRSFFRGCLGRARGFLFKDTSDFSSASDDIGTPDPTDQSLGTGDGATANFQLRKGYSNGVTTNWRKITRPKSGTIRVSVDGVEQTITTDFTVSTTTGIVTFVAGSIPAAGTAVTAGFEFYVPVFFDVDYLPITVRAWNNFEIGSIPIIEELE